ncbi:NAD(P)/FAD-dependent oxidoreductase [Aneurinibacillus aneurinilyticus]|jgi:predicted NAD/FAD-dependent oxidoreductase|uniref:FAD-dependent oxidoreductase n=1 Tax=Aneurinibacillus aneurinilyticus TaxID=1391 RepID=A0A848CQR0_ANEAE|nr:FAD-dependent oxidoreductase [Aneurinibacillus aneurinilyticus]MCI1692780.1 FAD-dependent oxidoreductase [Aneurinibacillus aneurinilyticus]MED0668713.1 FAD-dependent oxidoreductase [Aneurinibacillus aneurinilyticus]NME97341.1 FAD-dependent oxidoreductase [Aneurinibacillus aneurinilyticus]
MPGVPKHPIVVIGGGISGLMAARTLVEAGEEQVVILDKGRSGGGRMATREIGRATFDHGAQYFTVRTPEFAAYAQDWKARGWITEWFGEPHARYRAEGGMNRLTRHLAEPLDICVRVRVTSIEPEQNGWLLHWVSEEQEYVAQTYDEVLPEEVYDPGNKASIRARAVLITAPPPQALYLLRQGGNRLNEEQEHKLAAVRYLPCLAALLKLDGASAVPEPGYVRAKNATDPVQLVVDNYRKGISSQHALTIYACGRWSRDHFNRPDDEVLRQLLQEAHVWRGDANIVEAQLKRWRFSLAETLYPARFADLGLQSPALLAGDSFIAPEDKAQHARIETAALSGIAAAKRLLHIL